MKHCLLPSPSPIASKYFYIGLWAVVRLLRHGGVDGASHVD